MALQGDTRGQAGLLEVQIDRSLPAPERCKSCWMVCPYWLQSALIEVLLPTVSGFIGEVPGDNDAASAANGRRMALVQADAERGAADQEGRKPPSRCVPARRLVR